MKAGVKAGDDAPSEAPEGEFTMACASAGDLTLASEPDGEGVDSAWAGALAGDADAGLAVVACIIAGGGGVTAAATSPATEGERELAGLAV